MTFLDNHDKNSYENTIMSAFGADALPSLFSLIYTIPGTPLVYTGDEIGLDHFIAFMEKDTIDWNSTSVSYRELLAELAGLFEGCDTVLLHGQGADVLNMEDRPLANAGLEGEVTLQPWEFWIASGGNAE